MSECRKIKITRNYPEIKRVSPLEKPSTNISTFIDVVLGLIAIAVFILGLVSAFGA